MAFYVPGYEEERFVTAVSKNFICSICFNVLRDPVLCRRNQHCFCRSCITRHLENSRRCPACADPLSVATLTEPQRMVKDYLNELKIRCVYLDRGCQEIVQLEHLQQHEDSCGFTPAICSNRGCGVTVNKRDLIHHESEVCELRKLKCHSCEEMTKTLADVGKRIENVEKNMSTNLTMKTEMAVLKRNAAINMATVERNVAKNMATIERNVASLERSVANVERNGKTNVANLETNVANLETNMRRDIADIKTHLEGELKAVNDEVVGVKTALIEAFDQMKDILVKVEGKVEEQPRKKRRTESCDGENIIVAGGFENYTVEMFNWLQRTWSPLQSLPQMRLGATSFVYNNYVTTVGGYCFGTGYFDDMIRMIIEPFPDLSTHWSVCRAKLPAMLAHHSSVLYDGNLMVTGGFDGNAASSYIDEVQVVPPYAVKTLARMPEPREGHCMEMFDDSLLIIGGSTSDDYKDSLSSVALYDIKNNVCKQLTPLPYEVSDMATVRWGDNVVVIGGIDKRGKPLNTVIMYNVVTGQSHMLPPMRCKRWGCTAVVVGNNIVVLGGKNEQLRVLKSVEAFNFQLYTWQELPEMSRARYLHTAVVA